MKNHKVALFSLILIILLISLYFILAPEKIQENGDFKNQTTIMDKHLVLKSPVFENNGDIPKKYTCDGENINPPLLITDAPESAKSFVLIIDDPDAPGGTWLHWLVWNISPQTKEIAENSVPLEAVLGKNDFGKTNYGGPCPPSGVHRYFFQLYALDTVLNLEKGASRKEVEDKMAGHILDKAELVGLYKR